MLCSGENKRWNIFARELEDLLLKHGYDLSDLVSQAGLHPEKVRRLKKSLAFPLFHVLNPEDLEQVSEAFAFTGEEQIRVRAAILATAVEETLMNRIDPENALRAAEEIFPLLVNALQQRFGRQSGLAATRKFLPHDGSKSADDALDPILEQLDRAMLALYMGQRNTSTPEQLEQIARIREDFHIVLARLDALCRENPAMTRSAAWQFWHQEVEKNLKMVEENLSRLQP